MTNSNKKRNGSNILLKHILAVWKAVKFDPSKPGPMKPLVEIQESAYHLIQTKLLIDEAMMALQSSTLSDQEAAQKKLTQAIRLLMIAKARTAKNDHLREF